MKILDELIRASGFDSMIVTTYGADLPWFESLLLRNLRGRRLKRLTILMDENELSSTLDRCVGLLRGAGRSYAVHPVPGFLTFHPKLFLLLGQQKGRLYVGSGNLTRGGLDSNLEVFDRWDMDVSDGFAPAAFKQAQEYLSSLVESGPFDSHSRVIRSLGQDLSHPIFEMSQGRAASDLWFSPGALLDRVGVPPSPADRLRIVSPFFDENAAMAVALAERLQADSFEVITDLRKTNLTSSGVDRIEKAGGTVLVLDADTQPRPLHGKLLHAHGHGWSLGITGSANASHAAWRGRNAELVVARRGESASEVGVLVDSLKASPISPEEVGRLPAEYQLHEQADESPVEPIPRLLECSWAGLSRLRIRTDRDLNPESCVEFMGPTPDLSRVVAVQGMRDDRSAEFVAPEGVRRGEVCCARVRSGDRTGSWVLVFDPEELADQAREGANTRQMLEEMLGSESFDPTAAVQLMRAFAQVQREIASAREGASSSREANSPKDNESGDEIRYLGLEDFGTAPDRGHSSRSLEFEVHLSVRLMNRLLLGDPDAKPVDADEGESELDEETVDDRTSKADKSAERSRKSNPAKATAFLEAAAAARSAYLSNARQSAARSPVALYHDLQVLAAPLFYMLKADSITPREFLSEFVPLLREMLGWGRPLVRSLNRLDEQKRAEVFKDSPIALLTNVLVYSACAAYYDSRSLEDMDPTFGSAAPAFWVSSLAHTMPSSAQAPVREMAALNRSQLRQGIFWLEEEFPRVYAAVPFSTFVTEMLEIAEGLPTLRLRFDEAVKEVRGQPEEGESILAALPNGRLGAGWSEEGRTIVRSSAFESPDGGGYFAPMRSTQGEVIEVEVMRASLLPSDVAAHKALRMLERAAE